MNGNECFTILVISFIFIVIYNFFNIHNPKSNDDLFNELQEIKKDVQSLQKFINENKTQISDKI